MPGSDGGPTVVLPQLHGTRGGREPPAGSRPRHGQPASEEGAPPGHAPRRLDVAAPVLVKDVMRLSVVTVHPQATLEEAVDLLVQNHVSGLPVVQDSRVVGILSEKDIVRHVLVKVGLSQLPSHLLALLGEFSARKAGVILDQVRSVLAATPVSQAMTPRPIIVAPDTPVDQAAQNMIEHQVHRLPVVDRERLVGIVTRDDITRVSAAILSGGSD